ncbi:MAG: helix-turn-helix domain-containing protein [Ruminococcaceae bacterium]|nr:helix-turn-helix domain-containing protein [Oscillospiraceae bacterium]
MEQEYSTLYDLITYLEYGTKLHIGVLFLGNHGNRRLSIPFDHTIHSCPVCAELKKNKQGFRRCYRCRNTAIQKAIRTKVSFGGLCINGVYEYISPVVINGEVVCILFIGNILSEQTEKIKHKLSGREALLSTMEPEFGLEQCKRVGKLLEQHIVMTMEQYPDTEDFDPLIDNLKGYIEENLEYKIDLRLLAEMFHYNEKYLGRLFKKKTGTTFCEYITERRMERAKHFLRNGDETVLTISEKCGFNNVTYFNRMFHKYVGKTPCEYRKEFSR